MAESMRFVICTPATKLLPARPKPDCVARMAWNRNPVSPPGSPARCQNLQLIF